MEPFQAKLAAAATGATVTALTMTPFDVVKTRLQTQPRAPQQPLFPTPPAGMCCQPASRQVPCVRRMSSLAPALEGEVVCVWDHGVLRQERVTGFFDAIRRVVRAEGVNGLWKGAGTALVIGVPSSTAYMLTYDHLLNVTLPTLLPAPAVPLCSGMLARTLVSSFMSPLELIRTNLQSTPLSPDNPHTLRSVLTSVETLTRAHGINYLYRGLGPTLWRDVPFSGLYWTLYETCKAEFAREGFAGPQVAFASGAIGGTTAALITSPFDVLKTRRQAVAMQGQSAKTATFPLMVDIVRNEGITALYAGILPRIVKIAPACGIMIGCFEGVGKFLAKREEEEAS